MFNICVFAGHKMGGFKFDWSREMQFYSDSGIWLCYWYLAHTTYHYWRNIKLFTKRLKVC